MAVYYPPVFINAYLAEKIPQSLPGRFNGGFRFFPTSPTDIDILTQNFPEAANDVFGVYDRMFKMRRKAFPHIKSEQLLYYFYKTSGDPEALIETSQLVQDFLDRGDESAQEINAWLTALPEGQIIQDPITGRQIRTKVVNGADFCIPFFHEIKIYQLEETRDIIDFGTARTFAGNKIIIDYDWHQAGIIE